MNLKKIKWGLFIIAIVFLAGGLWQPILYSGEFELIKFIIGGIYTLIILLAGGGLFWRWATKPCESAPDTS